MRYTMTRPTIVDELYNGKEVKLFIYLFIYKKLA